MEALLKMKTLKHQGIYIPSKPSPIVDYLYSDTKRIILNKETAYMALHWVKKLETDYVKDPIFRKNFFTDFCVRLGIEYNEDFGWSKIKSLLTKQMVKKKSLSKEERKKAIEARKKTREVLRNQYGVATVDSTEVEINNWTAEPSCIFMGRGEHPSRGKWKDSPEKKDIILNLSPDSPQLEGWKEIVWKPDKLWIASWTDKLSGKTKYVWFSDSFGKKQEREKAKFDKARELGKNLEALESHITQGLYLADPMKRKIAGVCYLIFYLNMRVGDEKDPGEADTVGAITLRPEHIKILGTDISLDFLGKDSVRWTKSLEADKQFINILQENSGVGSYIFDGVTSKMVTKFLRKIMSKITAKTFRIYRATEAVKTYLKEIKDDMSKEPDFIHKYEFKLACLQAAKICNHKKALPKGYVEKLQKKEDKINATRAKIREMNRKDKDTTKQYIRLSKNIIASNLYRKTSEWNLGTSMKSYIDPRAFETWAQKNGFSVKKFYSAALQKKYSWIFDGDNNHNDQ